MTRKQRVLSTLLTYQWIPSHRFTDVDVGGNGGMIRLWALRQAFNIKHRQKSGSAELEWLLITPPELIDFERCRVRGQLALVL